MQKGEGTTSRLIELAFRVTNDLTPQTQLSHRPLTDFGHPQQRIQRRPRRSSDLCRDNVYQWSSTSLKAGQLCERITYASGLPPIEHSKVTADNNGEDLTHYISVQGENATEQAFRFILPATSV